jgi:hypothetical protein
MTEKCEISMDPIQAFFVDVAYIDRQGWTQEQLTG